MPLPTAFLKELTRQRIIEELEDIERDCKPSNGGAFYLSSESVARIRDLRMAVERLGVVEAQ